MPYFDLKPQLAPKCKIPTAPIVGQWSYTVNQGEGDELMLLAEAQAGEPVYCGGTITNKGCYDIYVSIDFLDGDDCNSCTVDDITISSMPFLIRANQGYTLPDSFWQRIDFTVVDSSLRPNAILPITVQTGTQVVTLDSAYTPQCCVTANDLSLAGKTAGAGIGAGGEPVSRRNVYFAVGAVMPPANPVVTTFDVSLFLEGPFDSGPTMRTTLNDFGLLPGQDPFAHPANPVPFISVAAPIGQPYSAAPWGYAGTEGDTVGDPAAGGTTPYATNIVDRVLVSVRTSLNPGDTVFTGAGLLANDGTVTMFATPTLLEATDYYVVVEHRNHLASISPATQVVGGILYYDFRVNNTTGQQALTGGVYGLVAANGDQVNGRAIISTPDDTLWTSQNGQVFRYLPSDFNMNGDVNSADRAIYINNDNTTTSVLF